MISPIKSKQIEPKKISTSCSFSWKFKWIFPPILVKIFLFKKIKRKGHVNKENKSTNCTSKDIFHSIITHEKVSHLIALFEISHGFFSCINEDLLFERSMRKWACQKGEQNPRNFSPLKFHLGFIFWNHRQRWSSNEFWGHKKGKERWSSKEKRKERRKGCALLTREFLSLPIK